MPKGCCGDIGCALLLLEPVWRASLPDAEPVYISCNVAALTINSKYKLWLVNPLNYQHHMIRMETTREIVTTGSATSKRVKIHVISW